MMILFNNNNNLSPLTNKEDWFREAKVINKVALGKVRIQFNDSMMMIVMMMMMIVMMIVMIVMMIVMILMIMMMMIMMMNDE